jgi:hypothetical protein
MTGQLADPVFQGIADTPFDAYMAALESWQLAGHGGELRLGDSLLRGPIEHDQHFGTWRIEVCLSRGRLRSPVRMRLDIAAWYAGSTALELIPCQRVRPSAAYLAAGHRLLDFLTRTLPVHVPVQQHLDQDDPCAIVSAGSPALSHA